MAAPLLAPLLMYGVPATLGGITAYRQTGGNLGATALGAGLGAAAPAGLRMAGTAIAGVPAVSGLLSRASSGLAGRATSLGNLVDAPGIAGAAAQAGSSGLGALSRVATPAAIGAGAGWLGANLGGPVAGNIASGLAGPAQTIAGGATSAGAAAGVPGLGANQPPGVYPFDNALPPGLDPRFGAGEVFGGMSEAANPLGYLAGSRLASEKEMDASLRNAQKTAAMLAPWTEGAKRADLTRNLYGMTVRNNQTAQLQNLLGSLQTARQMGQTAASQAGQALATQYQYV